MLSRFIFYYNDILTRGNPSNKVSTSSNYKKQTVLTAEKHAFFWEKYGFCFVLLHVMMEIEREQKRRTARHEEFVGDWLPCA